MRTILPVFLVIAGCGDSGVAPVDANGSAQRAISREECDADARALRFPEEASAQAVASARALLQACPEASIAGALADAASRWHGQAAQRPVLEALDVALSAYGLYLEHYGDREAAADIVYYTAELLWTRAEMVDDAESWRVTARAFDRVGDWPDAEPGRKSEALYAAILAWKNAMRAAGTIALDTAGEAGDMPEEAIGMLAAMERYLESGEQENRGMVSFLRARAYWRYDDFDAAIPLLIEHIERFGDEETGEYAVNMLMDTLIRQESYDQLRWWARAILNGKTPVSPGPELRQRLGDILRRAAAAESP
jgi:hypothetical protein